MDHFRFLTEHFFTHKDFLPPPDRIPGTLFTPLQLAVSFFVLCLAVLAAAPVSVPSYLYKKWKTCRRISP